MPERLIIVTGLKIENKGNWPANWWRIYFVWINNLTFLIKDERA